MDMLVADFNTWEDYDQLEDFTIHSIPPTSMILVLYSNSHDALNPFLFVDCSFIQKKADSSTYVVVYNCIFLRCRIDIQSFQIQRVNILICFWAVY